MRKINDIRGTAEIAHDFVGVARSVALPSLMIAVADANVSRNDR